MEHEHVHGNFHSYYKFNPASERLQFLSISLCTAFQKYAEDNSSPLVLCDLGCNEGDLSLALQHAISTGIKSAKDPQAVDTVFDVSAISALNDLIQKEKRSIEYTTRASDTDSNSLKTTCEIRIDSVLYGTGEGKSKKVAKARASERALHCFRQQLGNEETGNPQLQLTSKSYNHNIDASSDNISQQNPKDETSNPTEVYLLGVDIDGNLIDRARKKVSNEISFLRSTFETADIQKNSGIDVLKSYLSSLPSSTPRFHLITCFSMTMWIHLHHGDDGLLRFLSTISELTDHLIIEPQPWKCYRQALRRIKQRNLPIPTAFDGMKLREDVVDRIEEHLIRDCGFHFTSIVGKTNWSRRIQLFSKIKLPGVSYA